MYPIPTDEIYHMETPKFTNPYIKHVRYWFSVISGVLPGYYPPASLQDAGLGLATLTWVLVSESRFSGVGWNFRHVSIPGGRLGEIRTIHGNFEMKPILWTGFRWEKGPLHDRISFGIFEKSTFPSFCQMGDRITCFWDKRGTKIIATVWIFIWTFQNLSNSI